MPAIGSSTLLAGCTLSAFVYITAPAYTQTVAIPVTGGSYTLTRGAVGNPVYTALPTFLSPAGTINITAGDAPNALLSNPTSQITTTDTPTASFLYSLSGSASLNDGRTSTFTGGSAALRGEARMAAGVWNVKFGPDGASRGSEMPFNSTVIFTVRNGSVNIPVASLSAYPTPQFTIPITGGSFTLTENTGMQAPTIALNGVLSPLGTTNLTVTYPRLSSNAYQGLAVYYNPVGAGDRYLGGLVNGTVALNDGRTAVVTNQVVFLNVTNQIQSGYVGGEYVFNALILNAPLVINGSIVSGQISIPESAVLSPPPPAPPVPPALPIIPEPIVVPPAIAPVPAPEPPQPEFVLGFAPHLNLGGEPEDYLKLIDEQNTPSQLPEEDASPLNISRIHSGLYVY